MGIVIEPVVTTSDVGLPDTMPYMPDEMTATLAGPPGCRPEIAAAKSKKNINGVFWVLQFLFSVESRYTNKKIVNKHSLIFSI